MTKKCNDCGACNTAEMKQTKTVNESADRNRGYVYSFYSNVLKKPFESLDELEKAEDAYFDSIKAKEDQAAQKKADAKKVEDAFKALNAARKTYKEQLTQLTVDYTEELKHLQNALELAKKDIHDQLATAEDNYAKALKEFTDAHPEGYHVTLKDSDFETTISHKCETIPANKKSDNNLLNLFDLFFGF